MLAGKYASAVNQINKRYRVLQQWCLVSLEVAGREKERAVF
jgi:hypothetical protein